MRDKIAEIIYPHKSHPFIETSRGAFEAEKRRAKHKADKILALPIMKECPECEGHAQGHYEGKLMCPTCKGKGEVPVMHKVKCPNSQSDECVNRSCWGTDNCCTDGKIKRPTIIKDLVANAEIDRKGGMDGT